MICCLYRVSNFNTAKMASHFTVFEYTDFSFLMSFLKPHKVTKCLSLKRDKNQSITTCKLALCFDFSWPPSWLICLNRSRKFQYIIQLNSKNMPTWNYEMLTTQKRVICDFILILMSKLNFSYFILMFTGIAMTHWYQNVYLPDQPATHASRRLAFWPAEFKYLYKILW